MVRRILKTFSDGRVNCINHSLSLTDRVGAVVCSMLDCGIGWEGVHGYKIVSENYIKTNAAAKNFNCSKNPQTVFLPHQISSRQNESIVKREVFVVWLLLTTALLVITVFTVFTISYHYMSELMLNCWRCLCSLENTSGDNSRRLHLSLTIFIVD